MKLIDEILASNKVIIVEKGVDGFYGEIHLCTFSGGVIASTGAGWEHVSVAPYNKRYIPTWDDMCCIKDIFFRDDEAAIQVHPPKEEYVNNVDNCLHLWRCTYQPMVLPPSCLIGVRDGQSQQEFIEEIKKAYEIAGEKY